jgi:exopolysaccharide biosynthesis polyprenyl glycosylphosphotransferase
MLLEGEELLQTGRQQKALQDLLSSLSTSVRETDVTGWFRENSVVGVIFTEVDLSETATFQKAILERVSTALRQNLSLEQVNTIKISLHVLPDEWDEEDLGPPARLDLYPDLEEQKVSRRFALRLKRIFDIAVSLIALLLLSPLFVLIAALIKLTSKGPVFFRQTRVGQFGERFTFLKFRTMHVSNNTSTHKDYVRRFISGKTHLNKCGDGQSSIYKLIDDPRVTRAGRFLRRSSLDELPQLLNVLKGEMSLVGPRPPLPYEFVVYEFWHRRRVLEAKPGITGLWQVNGRSTTTFDEMVRLDLHYARSWSLWLDLQILLKTPRAVFSCEGAY